MNQQYKILQSLLREIRQKKGLRQTDLSDQLGQPQSFVSKYESGERRLDIIEIRLICKALDVSFIDFINRLNEKITQEEKTNETG